MAALFFNQRKPRGFNYRPRYYDPETEAREERKKIVLGEKYRSPARLAREAAEAAGTGVDEAEAGAAKASTGAAGAGLSAGSGTNATNAAAASAAGVVAGTPRDSDYVPGVYLREHIAARRGNAHAADVMRRRRRKTRSVYVLFGMLALIVLIVWMLYFR